MWFWQLIPRQVLNGHSGPIPSNIAAVEKMLQGLTLSVAEEKQEFESIFDILVQDVEKVRQHQFLVKEI
jgi:hypothetical protein